MGAWGPETRQMPYFALTDEVVDDFVSKRAPFRPAHLKKVREARGRGELIMAGAAVVAGGAAVVVDAAVGLETPPPPPPWVVRATVRPTAIPLSTRLL